MSAQAVVREALKQSAAARLRAGQPPTEWAPQARQEEAALNELCRRLLDIEGSLLAYWTDIPQTEIQRVLPLIREALGDYVNPGPESVDRLDQAKGT